VGLKYDMTIRVDSMAHICETRPPRRVLHDLLLFNRGDCVQATGADEVGSAQKAAAWLEPPVTFPDTFATDTGCLQIKRARSTRLRRLVLLRQTLLGNPGNEDSDNPITSESEQGRNIARAFRST